MEEPEDAIPIEVQISQLLRNVGWVWMASEIDSIETSELKASKFQKPYRAFLH
jgi:hypothetical protein